MKKITRNKKKNVNSESKAPTEKDYTKAIANNLMNRTSNTQHNEFYDSTSMVELTVMKESFVPLITNEGKITDKIDKALNSIEKSPELDPNLNKDEKKQVIKSELAKRANMLREAHADLSKTEKAVVAAMTGVYVNFGDALNDTKKFLNSHTSHNWERWADENLGIKKRTRQAYMKLAKILNVRKYIMLGKERILHVDQVTKGIVEKNNPDPIGAILQKHDIDFEQATEIPIVEFKNLVDTAVVIEKASKKDLDLDRESVHGLIERGFKFTNTDFQQFVNIKESKGEPNKLLEKLLINKGRRDKVYEQSNKKKASFIRTTAQITELVDQMIENKEFEDIKLKDISDLIKKLELFKEKFIKQ